MQTPDRILRADAENLERDPPELSHREQEQYARILTVAEGLMARHGIHTMTASSLAQALRMGTRTLRRHFSDLDALLATLIRGHLRKLAHAIGQVPRDAPNRPEKQRAAYLAHTRTGAGALTDAHLLLVRDRHLLPADLLTYIEQARRNLGETLAPGHAENALALLDMPALDAPCIEAALTSITAAIGQHKPAPPAAKPATAATPRRDRTAPARPPWAPPRNGLDLLQFGPVPTLPNLPHVTARPQIHSSA
jgi:AcrR family transcriptional regulator